jgi:GLPGLI family protein
LIFSCNKNKISSKAEGLIIYNVTYIENKSGVPTHLLPNSIVLKFKNNNVLTRIDGFMGLFSVANIINLNDGQSNTLLKVMDNKFRTIDSKQDYPCFFAGLEKMRISLANENKEIAGLSCKKAIVSFEDKHKKPYEVYYTEMIELYQPNRLNPYKEIDGMMMQFNISLNNIEMRLTATKYQKIKINENEFLLPDGYKQISNQKMISIISELLE